MTRKSLLTLAILFIIGILIAMMPTLNGMDPRAMPAFAIFIFTVLGIIFKPMPMGAMAFLGLTLLATTKIATFAEAFAGFSHPVIWLVVAAFFLSRGFIKTNIGLRIAYVFMKYLGKNSLGVAYSLSLADLVLAPAIPSNTARVGGVIYPVARAISKAYGSEPYISSRKIGSFLILSVFQIGAVTSAMFLTSMAGNPLIADLAGDAGAVITWSTWAKYAIVPGIVSILIIPFLLYWLYPPEIKKTKNAYAFASQKLQELGRVTSKEYIMLFVFVLLLGLWIIGPQIHFSATVAALIGVSLLLLTNVLTWEDLIAEKNAFDTLIWFSALVTMAKLLNDYGFIEVFSQIISQHLGGVNWVLGLVVIAVFYFVSHYLFASNIAHISAMYQPLLVVSVAMGAPPLISALLLGFFSSLFGGLTHYGCGPAPILFGSGYVSVKHWWLLGALMGLVNLVIWLGIGGLWWKIIGV